MCWSGRICSAFLAVLLKLLAFGLDLHQLGRERIDVGLVLLGLGLELGHFLVPIRELALGLGEFFSPGRPPGS